MAQDQENILQPSGEAVTVQSYLSLILDSPPSCLEFVPEDLAYPHHFVVGTYSLETDGNAEIVQGSSPQTRSGSLQLFALKDQELELLETQITPYAILDLHFSLHDKRLFATAASAGAIDLYHLSGGDERSPNHVDGDALIGISLSDGQVGYVSYTGSDQSIQTARAHSMEAWTVAWSNGDDDELSRYCLYSGGDDSVLCKNGGHKDRVPRLPFEVLGRDSKSHSAGVTAILPTLVRESSGQQAIITGSYDEYVRVLLVSSGAGRSQVVAERRMPGGGVWRLKTLDEEDNDGDVTIDVLASCMHAGTRVLKICRSSRGLWSIRVVAKFVEHGSMNYASDARRGLPAEESGLTVISTSFYDRKLCVWDFDKRS